MKCRADNCEREATYKTECLCQKHYFRFWRNGSLETKLERKQRETGSRRQYRVTMPGKGYQRLYEPNHPLADKGGTVAEHRMVVFDRYGRNLPDCEICGKPMSWDDDIHIDHRDNDVTNNHIDNLRPLCRACNTTRDYPEQHTITGRYAVTYNGKTMTPSEWAREPGINIPGHTIRNRLKRGMSVEDALFIGKMTHNGKPYVDNRIKKTQFKYQRSNSIALTIDGVTMTANEWSRHPECTVCDATIRSRVKAGWDHKAAVFAKAAIKAEYRAKLKALTS